MGSKDVIVTVDHIAGREYVGYAETKDFNGEGVQNLKLVTLFLDETTVSKFGGVGFTSRACVGSPDP